MRVHSRVVTTFAGLVMLAAPAMAQSRGTATRPNSVLVSVSGGVQQAASDVSDHFSFSKNQETETVDVKYPMKPWGLFDVGGSFRVWKNLALGAAFSRANGSGTAEVTASVPHPFFFNQPRGHWNGERRSTPKTGSTRGQRSLVPVSGSVRIVIGAGPSWLSVEHESVTDITVTESYPFDTAAFGGAVTKTTKASATGYNAGIDVTWMFARSVGLGGLVRYSRADVDLKPATDRTLTIKAGGVQGAAGIRFAF
jgi:hypothetical protein